MSSVSCALCSYKLAYTPQGTASLWFMSSSSAPLRHLRLQALVGVAAIAVGCRAATERAGVGPGDTSDELGFPRATNSASTQAAPSFHLLLSAT